MSDDENTPGPKTSKRNLSAGQMAGLGDPPSLPPHLRLAQEQLDDALGPSREVLMQLLKASEAQLSHERQRSKTLEFLLKEMARDAQQPTPEEPDEEKNPYSQIYLLAEAFSNAAEHYLFGGPGERHQTAKLLRQLLLDLDEPLDLKDSREDLAMLQGVAVMHEWSGSILAAFDLAMHLDDTSIATEQFPQRLKDLEARIMTSPSRVDRWLAKIVAEAKRSEL